MLGSYRYRGGYLTGCAICTGQAIVNNIFDMDSHDISFYCLPVFKVLKKRFHVLVRKIHYATTVLYRVTSMFPCCCFFVVFFSLPKKI